MKKFLNTVYVTTEGASLKKDGENLVAEVDGVERARVPLHMLGSVVAFGAIYISPALIGACAGTGITLVLLDRTGRFQPGSRDLSPAMCCCGGRSIVRLRRPKILCAVWLSARYPTSGRC